MRNVLILISAILLTTACYKKAEKPTAHGYGDGKAKKADAPPPAASGNATVGAAMPAYTAAMLDGSTFDIANERGNVVLLNLWATWCGPCRYEIPELEALQKKHAAQKFKVVGVSIDETIEPVKEYTAERKIGYPLAHDPEGKLANLFQATVVPTSALVDRDGKVVWKHAGVVEANDPELAKALETALR